MAQLDLTERDIKLEHIEGYLYGVQEIDNHIIASQGATNEYSIYRLEQNNEISDSESIIELIFNKVGHYPDFTDQVKIVFNNKIVIQKISDWKTELRNNLYKWHIDKHLSERNIRVGSIKYMNQFNNWTEVQKENYTMKFEEAERKAKDRLQDSRKSIEILMNLIEVFMKSNFQLNKFDFSKIKESRIHYPRNMDFHWGWEFDMYQLKNENENVVIHFGKLLN